MRSTPVPSNRSSSRMVYEVSSPTFQGMEVTMSWVGSDSSSASVHAARRTEPRPRARSRPGLRTALRQGPNRRADALQGLLDVRAVDAVVSDQADAAGFGQAEHLRLRKAAGPPRRVDAGEGAEG